MERQQVTEESGIQKGWMERAKKIKNSAELKEFVDELTEKYGHDYGTICHAVAAAGIAAMNAVNHSSQGGITGFQAGAVIWEVIGAWGIWGDGPLQMVEWKNLCYPQYDEKMPRTITRKTFESVRKEAQEFMSKHPKDGGSKAVCERMMLLAEGGLPYGMSFRED